MIKNRKLVNDELNRQSVEEYKSAPKLPVVVVLDNIRSLNNVGSVFRTSDALMVDKVYLCGITGTPPDKEIHRTALGAENSVRWEYHAETIKAIMGLKEQGYKVVAVEQAENSCSLISYQPVPGDRYALVFGNELRGVEQAVVDLSDECIEIPQFGTKHSFNISVSVGIVLWDFFSKLNK